MSAPAPSDPNPYAVLRRVLRLRPAEQRKLLRLVVWCDRGECTPLRVFKVRDGLLVQCRSDADVSDMQEAHPHLEKWSRRRAFFLQEWLDLPPDAREDAFLQLVCECNQTTPRLVDVRRVADLTLDHDSGRHRNATLPEVAAHLR